MMEFLIKPKHDDFLDLPKDKVAQILRPISTSSKPIQGWGTHRIEALGCEIAFSDEMVGFQVCFDTGDIEEEQAAQLVEEIRQNVEKETGQEAYAIMITGKD